MSGFKVQDKVRLTKSQGLDVRLEGTVTQVLENWASGGKPMYVIQFDNFNDTYGDGELELVEAAEEKEPVVGEEIAFEKIRKGDRIRTVREFDGGFVLAMEGIAERLVPEPTGKVWRMGGTHAVAPESMGPLALKQYHILVEREEPKDHVIMFKSKRGSGEDLEATVTQTLYTKSRAEELVKMWNSQYRTINHRAVKVEL